MSFLYWSYRSFTIFRFFRRIRHRGQRLLRAQRSPEEDPTNRSIRVSVTIYHNIYTNNARGRSLSGGVRTTFSGTS